MIWSWSWPWVTVCDNLHTQCPPGMGEYIRAIARLLAHQKLGTRTLFLLPPLIFSLASRAPPSVVPPPQYFASHAADFHTDITHTHTKRERERDIHTQNYFGCTYLASHSCLYSPRHTHAHTLMSFYTPYVILWLLVHRLPSV